MELNDQERAELRAKIAEGARRMDDDVLDRSIQFRRDALARMQEHEMPALIIERQEIMVAATQAEIERRAVEKLDGEIVEHEAMIGCDLPDGTTLMLQRSYERECGCLVHSGFKIDDDLLSRLIRHEVIREIARDAFHVVLVCCEGHDALGLQEVWRENFLISSKEALDLEALLFAARILDRVAPA